MVKKNDCRRDDSCFGRERSLEIVEEVLKLSRADQTEVRLTGFQSSLTRYANSVIHQNVDEINARLSVKAYVGKKMGSVSTNRLDKESIAKTVERALELAELSPENPEFVSLPGPRPIPEAQCYFESTAAATPYDRADNVMEVIAEANKAGFQAAGAHSTGVNEIAVGNSLGVRAYGKSTSAELTCVIMSDEGSGYAQASSRDIANIDAAQVAEEAVRRCLMNKNQIAIEPGEYAVFLEPYAVAEMVSFLSSMGFSAVSYQEGRSFLCGKLGTEIVSPLINICDDGLDPRGAPFPFDGEGQPKSRVALVEQGVAKNLLYDSFAAFKEGKKESTGHYPRGMASNLFLYALPEDSVSQEELMSGVKRGILVTRFHYVRSVHTQKTIITGMTRDGTFLIEDGQVVSALKNLRFTESILNALRSTEGVGREQKLIGTSYSVVAPALRLGKFNFTGQAEH
ncbi:MAG: TldD/PmbA family protein [Bacillota bacterium]